MIAILCAARNSYYRELPGLDIYDEARDARTWPGGCPAVAHPPCRLWSAFVSHQAKSHAPDEERALGIWCIRAVQRWGGVVEQPAYSRLFAAAGVRPTITVYQSDWAHSELKRTDLFVVGNRGRFPPFPRMRRPAGSRRRQQLKSRQQRSATPPAFADWLVKLARLCDKSCDAGGERKPPPAS